VSTDGFFNILAGIEKIAEDFATGDPDSANLALREQLAIRGALSQDMHTASTHLQAVVAQQAYDVASVIDRQLTVLGLTRQDYQLAAAGEAAWLNKVYVDVRSHGTYNKNSLPLEDASQRALDEPYLNADNVLVFDDGTEV